MRLIIKFILAALLSVPSLSAGAVAVNIIQSGGAVSLMLDPSGGVLYGTPGQTVGWGFDLTTDASYGVSVELSDFCPVGASPPYPDPCTPLYTDYIGFVNGIYDNPGDPPQQQNFDPVNQLGYGAFVVQSAPVVGNLVLEYYLTDASGSQVTGNLFVSTPATVAPSTVPEPGSLLLLSLALAAFLVARRRPATRVVAVRGTPI